MADSKTKEDINTEAENDVNAPVAPSQNRRARNYMLLAMVIGLAGLIWVVTLLKMTMGAS
jgi:hypothetical protein